MKYIKDLVDKIDDEIFDAKKYAEKALELKAKGNMQWSNKFKEMSQQELNHSQILHDYTVMEIEELKKVYTPPTKMQEMWDESHNEYVERVAWIKQMLLM